MVNDPAHPVGANARYIDEKIVERWRREEPRADLAVQLRAMAEGSDDNRARHRFDEYLLAAAHVLTDSIPMVLHCPACGTQHIDQATEDWPNPPHTSHKCVGPNGCGCIWRPADVPTTGVEAIETTGSSDNWPLIKEMSEREDELAPPMRDEGDLGAEPTLLPACNKAPVGWRCTHGMGHDGPCATVEEGAPFQGGLVERQAVLDALKLYPVCCDIVRRHVPHARG